LSTALPPLAVGSEFPGLSVTIRTHKGPAIPIHIDPSEGDTSTWTLAPESALFADGYAVLDAIIAYF
jgi:hypothetical protein